VGLFALIPLSCLTEFACNFTINTCTCFSADVEIQISDEPGAVEENIEGSGYDDLESSALVCRSMTSTVLLSTAILLTLFTHS